MFQITPKYFNAGRYSFTFLTGALSVLKVTTTLDDNFSGTKAVVDDLQFDTTALAAYLSQHLVGFASS